MDGGTTSSTSSTYTSGGTTGGSSTLGCTTGGSWALINSLPIRSWIIMYHDLVNGSMPANGIDKILASSTMFVNSSSLHHSWP
jgi:hypothetical protein